MKKLLKIEYFPLISLAAGILSLLPQGLLFLLTLDEKGLVATGHILHILAWLPAGAALILSGVAGWQLHGHNRYGDNFPPSLPGAIGSFVLAGGVLVSIPFHLAFQGNTLGLLWLILAIVSVPCLVFTGLCRRTGKRPTALFHAVVCLFFAIHLVRCCQGWSREPQVETYVFALLASISLMLSAYHRAAFDAGIGRRRMQLLTGLAAGCLCLAAIPGSDYKLLYLTGSIWALTNLCVLTPPKRHRRTAEAAENTTDTPDNNE